MKFPKLEDVSSKFGAPMGRSNSNVDPDAPVTLQVSRLKMVDGDYDAGGAYWGACPGTGIYRAAGHNEDGDVVEMFTRATGKADALAQFREEMPAAKYV